MRQLTDAQIRKAAQLCFENDQGTFSNLGDSWEVWCYRKKPLVCVVRRKGVQYGTFLHSYSQSSAKDIEDLLLIADLCQLLDGFQEGSCRHFYPDEMLRG